MNLCRTEGATAEDVVYLIEGSVDELRNAFSWIVDKAEYGKYIEDPVVRDALVEEFRKGDVRPECFGEKRIFHLTVHVD